MISHLTNLGLFQIQKDEWVQMLKLVRCEIIGFISNEFLHAYLLSESSMFVSPYCLVLKTCGTTTLLLCLEKLLKIASSVGLKQVDQFFYSRKSFMFPEYQKFPHTNWDVEIAFVEKKFKNGSAYVVGKTNGSHWYCYTWEVGRCAEIKQLFNNKDYTLEILMCELDTENSKIFTKEGGTESDGAYTITKELSKLYSDVTIDDHMFDPCGYSCNGISGCGCYYFNVHVTPESHCSYASFETNIPPTETRSYSALVAQVAQIFKPAGLTVTLFAEKEDFDEHPITNFGQAVPGFKRLDRIHYDFEHYDLAFYHYVK